MFGSICICQLQCLVHVFYKNQLTIFQRLRCNFPTGQFCQLPLYFFHHFHLKFLRSSYQHSLAVNSVLSLRKQICSDKNRTGRCIGQYFNFRRTGRHIDRYITQTYQLLGSRHILISRTKDFIDFGNTFRSICHCSNGLHTSCFEDFTNSRQLCSEKNSRMDISILIRRSAKYNFLASCNFSGNS